MIVSILIAKFAIAFDHIDIRLDRQSLNTEVKVACICFDKLDTLFQCFSKSFGLWLNANDHSDMFIRVCVTKSAHLCVPN